MGGITLSVIIVKPIKNPPCQKKQGGFTHLYPISMTERITLAYFL
jgi:hypothetical protein